MTELQNTINKIKAVGFALNDVEVKGKKNLDILLGSIQALEQIADVLTKYANNPVKLEVSEAESEE